MSRIAYVATQGGVHTANQDGSDRQVLASGDMTSSWPTWSPDGQSIAFSGVRSGGNGLGHIGVYLKRPGEAPPGLVYGNEPGTDAIARETPHYVLWSPDSRRLAFIAQTATGGLSLFVQDTSSADQPKRLIDGGPLYMSWSSDSRYLLIHSHRSHYLMDFDEGEEVSPVPGAASMYMAPSWSPVGKRMAMLRDAGDERQTLLIADMDTGDARRVSELNGFGAFAWSPQGESIALARDLDSQSGLYPGLWLLDAAGSGERQITEDRVLCFFWSPDGGRIAYVTLSEGAEGSLRWAVVDVPGGAPRYLADFRPSQEQLTTFMFFDQYGQSHSLWSPDSRHLIFCGVLGEQRVRTQVPDRSLAQVLVSDIDGAVGPQEVAAGFLAFWCPV